MIFTTECPSCVTEFPIDSGKVPDDGVYARCSECEAVFLVETPSDEAWRGADAPVAPTFGAGPEPLVDTDAPPAEAPYGTDEEAHTAGAHEPAVAPDTGATTDVHDEVSWSDDGSADVSLDVEEQDGPLGDAPATAAAPPPEVPAVADNTAVVEAPKAAPPVFGKRDPHERAARLARVLVSDMIAYHPDRHRKSLAAGTLPQDFEEEIQKSWDEYVDQVGKELAESTDFFREALNQVLARGQDVF